MIKLEEFVNERLKVTKNSGVDSIKTTLRKFMAWFTGEDEYHINKYDLEDRKFISSDESMSKGDITDFLYKHINDTIYVTEEPKEYRIEVGLRDESKSRLYDYSFEIDGIIFSIDARIYNDDELLSNNRQYIIIEKLKVPSKQLVPFEDINIVKFARALRKSGTIFVNKYTDEVITLSNYKTKIYLYSFGLEHPSDPYPMEIEIGFKTDDDWLNNEYIRNIEELEDLNKVLTGGDFKSLVEEIYNDIV